MSIAKRALLALAAWCIACAAHAEAGELRIAQQYGFSYLQLMVMQRDGLVEKHAKAAGLGDVKVTWAKFAAGNVMNDALLSGSLDIASGGVAPPIILWDKTRGGLDVRMISAMVTAPLYLNTTNPNVKSVKDFTAADRIGLPAVKVSNQATILAMAAAQALGKDKADSLNRLTVAMSHPDGVAALKNGSITAHFTSPPFQEIELEDPRVHRVLSSYEVMNGPLTFTVLWTTARFRDGNPKLYRAFVDALDEATRIVNADKRAAAELYVKAANSKEPVDAVYRMISGPEIEFTLTPRQIGNYAQFMYDDGLIRHRPASWKDLFFDDIHALPGS
jgi:NitT/TauT family transport system substrate-binding protein